MSRRVVKPARSALSIRCENRSSPGQSPPPTKKGKRKKTVIPKTRKDKGKEREDARPLLLSKEKLVDLFSFLGETQVSSSIEGTTSNSFRPECSDGDLDRLLACLAGCDLGLDSDCSDDGGDDGNAE